MKKINKSLSKKGVASLYVVIFATILFGVITLSFIRIILSESQQTGNDDLSQSAYDAAMAGVEDAKLAVNKWYKTGMSDPYLFSDDCNRGIRSMLYTGGTEEVKIQEGSSSDSSNGTEQAYTCVILKNVVGDYRSTLTPDTQTKVVPLAIKGADSTSTTSLSDVRWIEVNWFSEVNGNDFNTSYEFNAKSKIIPQKLITYPPSFISDIIKSRR